MISICLTGSNLTVVNVMRRTMTTLLMTAGHRCCCFICPAAVSNVITCGVRHQWIQGPGQGAQTTRVQCSSLVQSNFTSEVQTSGQKGSERPMTLCFPLLRVNSRFGQEAECLEWISHLKQLCLWKEIGVFFGVHFVE